MAYYTVWLTDGRRLNHYHVYARSSQDAIRLVQHAMATLNRTCRIMRVEYIRAVQRRPHAHHWARKVKAL